MYLIVKAGPQCNNKDYRYILHLLIKLTQWPPESTTLALQHICKLEHLLSFYNTETYDFQNKLNLKGVLE